MAKACLINEEAVGWRGAAAPSFPLTRTPVSVSHIFRRYLRKVRDETPWHEETAPLLGNCACKSSFILMTRRKQCSVNDELS